MNIYVGNLSYELTEDELRQVFEAYGTVSSVNIIKDRFSGQSKGFGFVEMDDEEAATRSIEELNDTELKGRRMKVNKARPRTDRGGRGGRGGYGRRF